jgi:hypothetical protein
MSILHEVETDFSLDPFIDNAGVAHIEFDLAADFRSNEIALMSVMLLPGGACQPGEGYEDAHDLRFGIRLRDVTHAWRVSPPDYSCECRDKYIRKLDRALVLENITTSVRHLVESIKPDQITMSTYYPNLPLEGLRKYEPICACVGGCRYQQIECFDDGTDGKRYWLFERIR